VQVSNLALAKHPAEGLVRVRVLTLYEERDCHVEKNALLAKPVENIAM
jgi:hypothetical protein